MNQQPSILTRIGQWLGRRPRLDEDLPLIRQIDDSPESSAQPQAVPTRVSLFRPFARRDAAIAQLQGNFNALADLMVTIRDNLDRQGRRQEELLGYLSHLPHALEVLPESHRVQAETLKAIHTQLAQQNYQQKQLTEILSKVSDAGQDQREHLETLRDRVESIHQHESSVSDNLQRVGSAMQTVSETSQASVEVLEQMRQSIVSREAQMQRMMRVQNMRMTIMLSIALALSAIALASVAIIGSIMLNRGS